MSVATSKNLPCPHFHLKGTLHPPSFPQLYCGSALLWSHVLLLTSCLPNETLLIAADSHLPSCRQHQPKKSLFVNDPLHSPYSKTHLHLNLETTTQIFMGSTIQFCCYCTKNFHLL